MNREERALARKIFQHKVVTSDGQIFEDLFVAVMKRANSQFIPIKPQGALGDRKNDGYVPGEGHYYQVFAPEDLSKSKSEAVHKLKNDFDGLKTYWNKTHPIKKFSFVINDKYKGSHPTIETDLADIQKQHALVSCNAFLASDLEDVLFSLPDDEILAVVGFVPDPEKILNVDYSVLNDVITHIRANKIAISQQSILAAPKFEDKIQFNGLGSDVAHLLNTASYQVGSIDRYFDLNSEFAKQEIRDHLSGIYNDIASANSELVSEGLNKNDLIFLGVLDALAPNQSEPLQSAALVVMAYYFEACDIFDEPEEVEEQ